MYRYGVLIMNNPEDQDARFLKVWKAFRKAVKNDNAAADMIYRSLRSDGQIKCSCSKPSIKRKRGSRFYVCLNCKHKYWFTSGTLFEGAYRLRAWLAAVWFRERGIAVSSSALAKLLDIAQSTALNIQKKVSLVLYEQMSAEGPVIAISKLVDLIIKRSKDSPASCHPSVEVQPLEEADVVSSFDRDALPMMPMSCSEQIVGQVLYFVRSYFHGVSLKYLQLYIVAFCCFRPDSKWGSRSILQVCLAHAPINYGELMEFSSPKLLRIDGI